MSPSFAIPLLMISLLNKGKTKLGISNMLNNFKKQQRREKKEEKSMLQMRYLSMFACSVAEAFSLLPAAGTKHICIIW